MSANKLFSPVFETEEFKIFHALGRHFVESEKGVHIVEENIPSTFLDLVYALNHFVVNENEITLFYDYTNTDKRYAPLRESFSTQISTKETTVNPEFLEDQINFLRFGLSDLMLNEDAGVEVKNEVESEIAILEAELRASRTSPTYVAFRYVREENQLRTESWKYDKHTHKYYINSSEILSKDIANHAFATGLVRHEHRHILEKFETAVQHIDMFNHVDNVLISEHSDLNVKTATIRHLTDAYVYRVNEDTHLFNFENMTAARAIEYVKEQTGADVSNLFTDILEESVRLRKSRLEAIDTFNEMISFLQDQRAFLAEHDRSATPIKEAEKMLIDEIADLRERISILENDDLDRNDGYINARVSREYEELESGSVVKVDALQFSSSAKEDTLTVFYEGDPYRIVKADLVLKSGEAI